MSSSEDKEKKKIEKGFIVSITQFVYGFLKCQDLLPPLPTSNRQIYGTWDF